MFAKRLRINVSHSNRLYLAFADIHWRPPDSLPPKNEKPRHFHRFRGSAEVFCHLVHYPNHLRRNHHIDGLLLARKGYGNRGLALAVGADDAVLDIGYRIA